MRLVPSDSVLTSLIVLMMAQALPAQGQDFASPNLSGVEIPKYISVPVEGASGHEFLVPLNMPPVDAEKINVVPPTRTNISSNKESSYAWHFFPLIDASRTIAFTTRSAQFWKTLQ